MNKVILLALFFSVPCFARDPLKVSCIIKQNARITVLYTNTNDIPVLVYLNCLDDVKDDAFYARPAGKQADENDPILIWETEMWYPAGEGIRTGTGDLHKKKELDRTVSLKKGESVGTTFPLWELGIYKDLARVLLFRNKNGASKDAQRAIDRNVTKLKVESFLIFLVKDASGKFVVSPSPTDLKNVGSFTLTKSSIETIEKIRKAEGAELPVRQIPKVPIPDPNAGDW